MKLPIQITFHQVSESESVKKLILDEAEQLDHYYPRIMGCRVVVDVPHRHQHKGNLYEIRIDLTIPGKELVVRRGPAQHAPHTDIYLAVRDAFREVRRQLQDAVREQRGEKKHHRSEPLGKVRRLYPVEDYGFLESPEGREIYFHRNSVLNGGFDRLNVGDGVRFVEERGDNGPQASTVEQA